MMSRHNSLQSKNENSTSVETILIVGRGVHSSDDDIVQGVGQQSPTRREKRISVGSIYFTHRCESVPTDGRFILVTLIMSCTY